MDIILKYTLKKIQEQTSQIPRINQGGCCHFSKLLSKELESRNIKYKITLYDSYMNLQNIRKNIKLKQADNWYSGCAHVCIKIGKFYMDGITFSSNSENIIQSMQMCDKSINCVLTHKELQYYSNLDIWNSQFNKRKYHPMINKIIINQFKIYDKLKNEQ